MDLGAIAVPMEVHSTQRSQPPRRHGSALWKYEQFKGTRSKPPSPFQGAEGAATNGTQSGPAKIAGVYLRDTYI